MTHQDALLKLLAIEPETRARVIAVTGWHAEETESVLDALVAAGKVGYRHGHHHAGGERLYYTKQTAADAGSLPVATRKSRPRVRADGGGLVRGERAGNSVWSWGQDAAGSGAEAV